jgi:hypothetical protein
MPIHGIDVFASSSELSGSKAPKKLVGAMHGNIHHLNSHVSNYFQEYYNALFSFIPSVNQPMRYARAV